MANEENAPDLMGGNISKIKEAVVEQMQTMATVETSREDLSAQMAEAFAKLEGLGLSRHAVKAARQYAKLDEDKRKGFDIAYDIIRECLGLPVQRDLFKDEAAQ